MFPIDGSAKASKGTKSRVSKGSYFLSLPDGLADILCTIISFSNSCFKKIPIHSFLVIHFVVINFSCFSFLLKVVVFFFFFWMDFCLACVTARFLLTSKLLLITCCQTNKQKETSEKIIHVLH